MRAQKSTLFHILPLFIIIITLSSEKVKPKKPDFFTKILLFWIFSEIMRLFLCKPGVFTAKAQILYPPPDIFVKSRYLPMQNPKKEGPACRVKTADGENHKIAYYVDGSADRLYFVRTRAIPDSNAPCLPRRGKGDRRTAVDEASFVFTLCRAAKQYRCKHPESDR